MSQHVLHHFWYVILTKPRSEIVAKEHLENQEYRTYLPIIQGIEKTTPLFPRYIFVQHHEHIDIRPVRSTQGVADIVRFGVDFAKVPDAVITELKHKEDLIGHNIIEQNTLKRGDEVEITDGVFEGYIGVFSESDGNKRAILFLNIMHSQQQITLDASTIQKI